MSKFGLLALFIVLSSPLALADRFAIPGTAISALTSQTRHFIQTLRAADRDLTDLQQLAQDLSDESVRFARTFEVIYLKNSFERLRSQIHARRIVNPTVVEDWYELVAAYLKVIERKAGGDAYLPSQVDEPIFSFWGTYRGEMLELTAPGRTGVLKRCLHLAQKSEAASVQGKHTAFGDKVYPGAFDVSAQSYCALAALLAQIEDNSGAKPVLEFTFNNSLITLYSGKGLNPTKTLHTLIPAIASTELTPLDFKLREHKINPKSSARDRANLVHILTGNIENGTATIRIKGSFMEVHDPIPSYGYSTRRDTTTLWIMPFVFEAQNPEQLHAQCMSYLNRVGVTGSYSTATMRITLEGQDASKYKLVPAQVARSCDALLDLAK